MSTIRPHGTPCTPDLPNPMNPEDETRKRSVLAELCRRHQTDLTNLLNFTKWWQKVPRPRQCKDSTSDGWDAGVDECLVAAESLVLDLEFVTEYTKGYNEAIETFVAVVKKMVR